MAAGELFWQELVCSHSWAGDGLGKRYQGPPRRMHNQFCRSQPNRGNISPRPELTPDPSHWNRKPDKHRAYDSSEMTAGIFLWPDPV